MRVLRSVLSAVNFGQSGAHAVKSSRSTDVTSVFTMSFLWGLLGYWNIRNVKKINRLMDGWMIGVLHSRSEC